MSYYQSNIDSDKQTEALQIEDQIITNTSQIKLLGVEIDEKLNFTSHISNICLRWLKAVSSTFQDVDFDVSLLPLVIT